MTALGPYAPPAPATRPRNRRLAVIGTYLWAVLPLLTCGFGAPIAFATALARRRSTWTLVGLVAHSALMLAGCGVIGVYGQYPPLWADVLFYIAIGVTSVVSTAHLLLIRSAVWAAPAQHHVPVARLSNMEVVDRARHLREQARRTAAADPMLAKRLGIGRPDLPRQYDDGGLVDLNHAPLHVLTSLPGVTERSARQIQDRVERSGPFGSLGEVMLVIEISPSFEHHLREYCVFIP
ncbi:helix-hairpin-helix domain-containing protein [Glycomyces sp. TRM65418]|uniref:helix-hairpin-helix domain-containing protein n=1 Tax=Glycomyces sp. TRM65418 TaxID=2867006 RepID=UPI001CE5526A|nr:helix-hairpin-helix domain-containing protein [Glycomyces sp. TRM65418]MCC3763630.1 helix-hairpin-helix domain-containing protein [Glycomyces sp. TRM65418]QZD57613.1 helix-hairpin-helix domain-containing protein [Glycomyces sp. TRM65418]